MQPAELARLAQQASTAGQRRARQVARALARISTCAREDLSTHAPTLQTWSPFCAPVKTSERTMVLLTQATSRRVARLRLPAQLAPIALATMASRARLAPLAGTARMKP